MITTLNVNYNQFILELNFSLEELSANLSSVSHIDWIHFIPGICVEFANKSWFSVVMLELFQFSYSNYCPESIYMINIRNQTF
jgi:hypothetical protein